MEQSRTDEIAALRHTISTVEQNLQSLKDSLAALEPLESDSNETGGDHVDSYLTTTAATGYFEEEYTELDKEEYRRYGRQMILPEFGLQGQLRLMGARVLIIGIGGLGCPAATYLAGAGVGRIGLMDDDVVEISNLHRQTIHTTDGVGRKKVESAVEYLRKLNSKPTYIQHAFRLTPANCLHILRGYDVILDCTDNPQSRYLISDACVLLKKLLITASATQTEGQLMTLGNIWKGSPCYRCVFPRPPPPNMVQSCSDSGVLGPAVGVMGVLMAVETIKIITQFFYWNIHSFLGRQWDDRTVSPTLLLYSAYGIVPFRTTYLKKPRKDCAACSSQATITRESLESGAMDYGIFCGITEPVNIIPEALRLSAQDFDTKVRRPLRMIDPDNGITKRDMSSIAKKEYVLVDVRESQDFNMCHILGSYNIPYSTIAKCVECPAMVQDDSSETEDIQREIGRITKLTDFFVAQKHKPELYFICRYGNDSQKAVQCYRNETDIDANLGFPSNRVSIMDIKGGLRAWSREVDPKFPEY